MATEKFKRKLTAVFSADVVGYSRLMRADEAATVETLTTNREIMASLIKQHQGRVVEALKINPNLSLERFIRMAHPFKNPAHQQRMMDALRKAGMPEKPPGAVP